MHNTTNPNDQRIANIDPVQKMWAFYNWQADQEDTAEIAKNHAYLVASFWNPEAVQKILGGGDVHISTDEEFEESTKMVKEQSLQLQQIAQQTSGNTRKRRKKTIINKDT